MCIRDRYKHLIGKMVLLPIVNKQIPIVADEYVERDFGTGVVKICLLYTSRCV